MLGTSTYLAPGTTFRSSEKRSKKTQSSVHGHGEQNSSSPTATTPPSEPSAWKQAWPQQHPSTGTGRAGHDRALGHTRRCTAQSCACSPTAPAQGQQHRMMLRAQQQHSPVLPTEPCAAPPHNTRTARPGAEPTAHIPSAANPWPCSLQDKAVSPHTALQLQHNLSRRSGCGHQVRCLREHCRQSPQNLICSQPNTEL